MLVTGHIAVIRPDQYPFPSGASHLGHDPETCKRQLGHLMGIKALRESERGKGGESLGAVTREASLRAFHAHREGVSPKASLKVAGSCPKECREEHSLQKVWPQQRLSGWCMCGVLGNQLGERGRKEEQCMQYSLFLPSTFTDF